MVLKINHEHHGSASVSTRSNAARNSLWLRNSMQIACFMDALIDPQCWSPSLRLRNSTALVYITISRNGLIGFDHDVADITRRSFHWKSFNWTCCWTALTVKVRCRGPSMFVLKSRTAYLWVEDIWKSKSGEVRPIQSGCKLKLHSYHNHLPKKEMSVGYHRSDGLFPVED